MKYFFGFIFLALFSFQKEHDNYEIRYFGEENSYDWKDCVNPPYNYIQNELPKIRKCLNEYVSTLDELDKLVHFIDFNNDNRLDVIYAGTSGSEADFVVFILNGPDEYKVLYEEYTNLRELEIKDNRLVGFTTLDLGCCAEYRKLETKYSLNDDLQRTHMYTRATTRFTEFPNEYFNQPIKFEVVNDVYKMRSSPVVDDTSIVFYDTISNVVSTYTEGAIGYAWAEQKDNKGRVWWFVEMEPSKDLINSKMNYSSDTLPMRNLGWMSSRYLNEIE